MNRFSYCQLLALIAVVFLVGSSVQAQTGGASVRAAVSETVALSISPQENAGMSVVSGGSRVTITSTDTKLRVLRVPLIVRSNTGFRISVVSETQPALLTQLSVIDVRATGSLVSPLAISGLDIARQFDRRGLIEDSLTSSLPLEVSHPLLLLNGPRVSLGGALASPHNALEITLLILLQPQDAAGRAVHLTFVGTTISGL
jgi:hypothetical protein